MFEVVTVAFWMADAYYYYSGCILLIQAISITVSMVQTRRVSAGGCWVRQADDGCLLVCASCRRKGTSMTWSFTPVM